MKIYGAVRAQSLYDPTKATGSLLGKSKKDRQGIKVSFDKFMNADGT